MSNKQAKQVKKVKQNTQSINRREMIHMDYLNVYNEVLKHEEVLDMDIDVILESTKTVLQNELSLSKLASTPTPEELEALVDKVLDHIETLRQIVGDINDDLARFELRKAS